MKRPYLFRGHRYCSYIWRSEEGTHGHRLSEGVHLLLFGCVYEDVLLPFKPALLYVVQKACFYWGLLQLRFALETRAESTAGRVEQRVQTVR